MSNNPPLQRFIPEKPPVDTHLTGEEGLAVAGIAGAIPEKTDAPVVAPGVRSEITKVATSQEDHYNALRAKAKQEGRDELDFDELKAVIGRSGADRYKYADGAQPVTRSDRRFAVRVAKQRGIVEVQRAQVQQNLRSAAGLDLNGTGGDRYEADLKAIDLRLSTESLSREDRKTLIKTRKAMVKSRTKEMRAEARIRYPR